MDDEYLTENEKKSLDELYGDDWESNQCTWEDIL